MKKFNAIFLIIICAITLFVCSCSASGGVSIGKQQSVQTVKPAK